MAEPGGETWQLAVDIDARKRSTIVSLRQEIVSPKKALKEAMASKGEVCSLEREIVRQGETTRRCRSVAGNRKPSLPGCAGRGPRCRRRPLGARARSRRRRGPARSGASNAERRGCQFPSAPREMTAPPPLRLFLRTPYGISVWGCVLHERYACLRPLRATSRWMADQGLGIASVC